MANLLGCAWEWMWSACMHILGRVRTKRAEGAGRTDGRTDELSSAIRDAASLFAFIFRFASTGEAERHDVTY